MAEVELDAAPSATPSPVSTDVPITTGAPPQALPDASNDARSTGWRRLDLGHPFVKLAMLGGMLLGLCGVAATQSAPPALPTPASVSASASATPGVTAMASSSAAVAGDVPESVLHDVDDDEQPPARRNGPRGARRRPVSHAPDAKAGVTTGYHDGEPMRVTLTIIDGKPVEEHTAAAFRKMRAAAQRDGVSLSVVSGFRTMERQRELYADYRAGRGHLAALPGHSNHQSGHALDLAVAAPKVRTWLEAHADEFGFRRAVPNEPWHWEH